MTKAKLSPALDAGVTLLAGGSAGFVLYAMPEGLLANCLAALRLSSFSPHFQPPFEPALRIGLAAAAALLTLAFVWSLLKSLDKPAREKAVVVPARASAAESQPEAPRFRKADAHPDAPARRPLLAGRDLGEPLDLELAQALVPEAEEEFVPQPDALVTEPPAEVEPIAAESAPEREPLPPFLVAQEPEEETGETQEEQAEEPSEDSIVSLMHRFETGLVRKKQALADARRDPPPPPAAAPAPTFAPPPPQSAPDPAPAAPAPVGHRLRSAIAGLQKASGG